MKSTQKRWTILHEDEDLIIINKPSGWLSVPARQNSDEANLRDSLKNHRGEIFVVHRIDRETSGIICFAKNSKAHRLMNILFTERKIEKKYLAITKGIPNPKVDTIDLKIDGPNYHNKMYVAPTGKEAISHYEVLETYGNYALVSVKIDTGRTHQIRLHLSARGYPLMVDPLYGHAKAYYLSTLKGRKYNLKKDTQEKPLLTRSPLHASELRFIHPLSNKEMIIESEMPKDMRAILNQFKKFHNTTSS